MSTQDMVSSIAKGSRVVYAVGEKEYNAIALDIVHPGYSQALRLHSAFLNLIYLGDEGEPVKVFAAPLLGTEADDAHLSESADAAARKDVRFGEGDSDSREAIYDEHLERLTSNPRTIGWRPGSVGDQSMIGIGEAGELTEAGKRWNELHAQAAAEAVKQFYREYPEGAEGFPSDPMPKSSGIDGDAGDWTQAGMDKDGFPMKKGSAGDVSGGALGSIPTQAEADAVAAAAAAEDAAKGKPEPLPSEKFKVDDKVRFTAESGNDTTPVYTISGGESGEGDSAFWFWRLDEMDGLFLGQNLVLAEEVNQAS